MALAEFGSAAGKYAAAQLTKMLIDKATQEIGDNLTPENVGRVLGRLAPGKRNKRARNAAKRALVNQSGGQMTRFNTAPVARNVRVGRVAPRFRSANGTYCISNREYVDVVRTGTTGAAQNFNIENHRVQPGLPSIFPWLSQVATTHQKYRFKKLKFVYVPVAATSSVGRVTIAFALDPLDPVPSTKAQLFQYPTSVEGSLWSSLELVVDCSRQTQLFTRGGHVADTDIKTYDFGQIFTATSNVQDLAIVMGEIFVEYEVELYTPKPSHCPASLATRANGVTIDKDNMFRDEVTYLNGASWTLGPDNTITFDAVGTYLVVLQITSTDGGIFLPTVTPTSNNISQVRHAVASTVTISTLNLEVVEAPAVLNFEVLSGFTNLTGVTLEAAMFTDRIQNIDLD